MSFDTPLAAFRDIVRRSPNDIAFLHTAGSLSFAGLDRMSARMRAMMVAQGVRRQTGVILSAPNSPRIAAAVLAAWDLGAYPVFVSPHAPASHLDRAQVLTNTACVIAQTDVDAPGDPAPVNPSDVIRADDIASVVFTSGSTGQPKGVIQSAASLLSGAERVGRLIGYGPGTRILCPVPFSHDYGWGQLLSCLCLGHALVLPDRDGIQAMADAIVRHRPSVVAGTPAVYAGMVYGISDIRTADLSSVGTLTSTGSHLSPQLVTDLGALFPGAGVFSNYGLSETYRSACLIPSARAGREASVGRAIEGATLIVVDDQGHVLPPDTEGEVVHLGDGTAMGYIGDPDRTAHTFRDITHDGQTRRGVMTGDIGRIDADGYLTLSGRRDRLIKTMDVRVSLDEVERLLMASGMLQRAAVVDIPDRTMGRKIVGFVVLRDGTDLAQIRAYARQHLSRYMLPRICHDIAVLPATPSGKVDYPALKALALNG